MGIENQGRLKITQMNWGRFLLVSLSIFSLTYLACSNLELGLTDRRFDEDMKNQLPSFSDFNPTDPNNFSFSMAGDTHIGSSGGYQLPRLAQISKADGDSFAVIAGDLTDNGDEGQFKTFLSVLTTASFTAYPCIGNHDIFFGNWKYYKQYIGRSVYSFNAGIVHFVVLDTANGQLGEKQMNWLDQDLAANASKLHKIVVMHYPPYVGTTGSLFQLSSDEEAAIFKDTMYRRGVELVLSGHYHGYVDSVIGNTRYVVSGGANTILDPGNSPHYLKVTVSPTALTITKKAL